MHRDTHAIQRPSALMIGLVLALAGMFLAVLPAPAFADELPRSFEIEHACQEGEADSNFTDIGPPHDVAIECLYWYGLAQGVTDTQFEQNRDVNRGEAATFLVRLLNSIDGFVMPEPDEGAFPDIANNRHRESIEQLAGFSPQILRGYTDGRFRPTQSIQRDQFASVVDRAIGHIAIQLDDFAPLPAGEQGRFEDVPRQNVHSDAIERLEEAGIMQGRTSDRFAPFSTLTRGQSASVIARTLGGLVYGGNVDRPADAPAATATGVVHDASSANPDEQGPAIEDATVEIRGDGARDLTTDVDGAFEVELPPGDYSVTVHASGFVPYQKDVSLEDGDAPELDFRMFPSAQPPAEAEESDTTAADVEIRDNFWIIPLRIDGEIVSVQEAEDDIILVRGDGVTLRLGSAGTDASWWNHDGDFTSNRGGDQAGDHTLYYEFDGHETIDDGWYSLTATFDSNGTLIAVNGVDCGEGQCVPADD
jgi:hypothetical protein